VEKDIGMKLCMLVRLLSGMSFSHFGELWLRGGSHRSLYTNRTLGKKSHLGKNFAARLGGQLELGGGICVLLANALVWGLFCVVVHLF